MKRVKAACLLQTLHFQLKEDIIGHQAAMRAVAEEVSQYKQQLDRRHVKYKIVEETTLSDGSVLMKIKRQYNHYDLGGYLD